MSAGALYNEIEPFACDWLENLIEAECIAHGHVDRRSVVDLEPWMLEDATQFHAFAGIGIWSHALRLAGWEDHIGVWTGSCPCFPAGTLVLTQRGYVEIEDVIVGDSVLTHRARWRRVTHTGSDNNRECVLIKGQGHWGMECTPNHPFLTSEKKWVSAAKLERKRWATIARVPSSRIPAPKVTRGLLCRDGRWRVSGTKNDETIYLGTFGSRKEAKRTRVRAIKNGKIAVRGADAVNVRSLKFARFLGYWVGDGWTTGDSVKICGGHDDAPLLQELMKGARLSCCVSHERTGVRAGCGSKMLVSWLTRHFGKGAANKRIPAWLHGAPENYRKEFLRGYFEADGHMENAPTSNVKRIQAFNTVSRALAVGIRVLLNQLGLSVSVHRSHARGGHGVIEGRRVNERPLFGSRVSTSTRTFKFTKRHGWGLVRSVTPARTTRVYNIAVEEDESYTADGIVVHNCQPVSQAGRRKGVDDERHLWPEFFRLISSCRPPIVFLEQVASSDAVGKVRPSSEEETQAVWIDAVQTDLASAGYAFGFAVFPACGLGAPHIRQRLFAVAYADGKRLNRIRLQLRKGRARRDLLEASGSSAPRWMADSAEQGRLARRGPSEAREGQEQSRRFRDARGVADTDHGGLEKGSADRERPRGKRSASRESGSRSSIDGHSDGVGDSSSARSGRDAGAIPLAQTKGGSIRIKARHLADVPQFASATRGFWKGCDWLFCQDGKWRPAKSSIEPLAHRPAERVGRLRAYGNAIVAPAAAAFIETVIDWLLDA